VAALVGALAADFEGGGQRRLEDDEVILLDEQLNTALSLGGYTGIKGV
jgi:hypothetical protein